MDNNRKYVEMEMNLQQPLETELVQLIPLQQGDFELLYHVASNPKVWQQHPNKDRWKEDIFRTFFEGAIESGGAYRIVDRSTGQTIGSSRYYDYDALDNSIKIGYTFYNPEYWGRGYNPSVKRKMLEYIFNYVSKVYFHIGAVNIRSQVSISRLGAVKVGEKAVEYFGEAPALNYIYCIEKADFKP